jgi:hypothetical protein
MNTQVRIILIFIFIFHSCGKVDSLEGKTLIGYVPMNLILDKEKPNHKWYYKTELTFKSDSVYIQKSPVSIHESDTTYSASDGGFYKYSGTWKDDTKFEINAVEVSCEYCPESYRKDRNGDLKKVVRKLNYKGKKTIDGLQINGTVFR